MVGVVVGTLVLALSLATASLSTEQLVLLAIAAPLVAYLGMRNVELALRPRSDQPFSILNWDARSVVLAPAVILIPYGTVALMTGVVSAAIARVRPPRHPVLIDAYNGAVMCLATLAMGSAARSILNASRTPLACVAAVAASVLLNEAVTFVLIVGIWFAGERRASAAGEPDPARPSATQLVMVSLPTIPIVIALASAIVISYVDGAYFAAGVLTIVPVLVIELLRHFGRTSVALQTRDQERDGVLRLILESAEEQRRALAEDLHDGPLQSVLACRLLVDDTQSVGASTDHNGSDERLTSWLDRASVELRTIVRGLVPQVLSERGLDGAIRHDADMLGGAVRHGIGISFAVDHPPSPSTELLLYRLAHEGLLNAVRHATAEYVDVDVGEEDGCYVVRVRDDGVGISAEELSSAWERGHLGIATLRERVALTGGTLDVARRDGGGTELLATLPVVAASETPDGSSAAARMASWWAGLPSWAAQGGGPSTSASDPQGRGRWPSGPPTPDPVRRASRRPG